MEKIKMTIIVDMDIPMNTDVFLEKDWMNFSLNNPSEMTLNSEYMGGKIGNVISVENIEILK